jgi:hypothetical protein
VHRLQFTPCKHNRGCAVGAQHLFCELNPSVSTKSRFGRFLLGRGTRCGGEEEGGGQLTARCRVHAKIALNFARAVPSPPRDATMISTSFTVSSWQLSGNLTTPHHSSPLLVSNSHAVVLPSPNYSALNSRLYNAGCTSEAAQQRANELQLEAEETVVVQLTQYDYTAHLYSTFVP